jgi:hypothetical protein
VAKIPGVPHESPRKTQEHVDTDQSDGKPPVLRMNAIGADGAQPFVFNTGETAAVLRGDTISGGEDTWNPTDIAQFRRLQIITRVPDLPSDWTRSDSGD